MTKSKLVLIILTSVIIFSNFILVSETIRGEEKNEIYVNESHIGFSDGTAEKPYKKIQDALDVAEDGDTIYIFGGLYQENLIINKRVKLIGGINEVETIIDSKLDRRYMIEVVKDEVTIEDIKVCDDDESMTSPIGALIYLKSDNNRIIGNSVNNTNSYGIYISSLSKNNIVSGNVVNDTKIGIYVDSSNTNDVVNNKIFNCSEYGIYLISSKENNRVYGNKINESNFGICIEKSDKVNVTKNNFSKIQFYSLYIVDSSNIIVQGNYLNNSVGDAIYLSSSGNYVQDNFFRDNRRGIIVAGNSNVIRNNTLLNQSASGIYIEIGYFNNVLYLNNFTKNKISAKDLGSNQWYYENSGNYWDDYNYVDKDLDGIGDISYDKNGIFDPYPLGFFLKPPNKPIEPTPEDFETGLGLSITLEVYIEDPDSEYMSVYFYKADDETLIDSITQNPIKKAKNDSRVQCKFTLGFDRIYSWYVIADDGILQNRSSTFVFVTRKSPPDNEPPVANASGPYTAKEGDEILFDSSACYDPDGTIDFYRWNFGDGSSEILTPNPTHVYEKPGDFEATLTIIDNNGSSDSDVVSVTIGELPSQRPTADLGGPYIDIRAGQKVIFDGSGSSDDKGIKNYTWVFHDGEQKYGQIVERSYKSTGTYLVELIVTDTDDQEVSDTTTVTIIKAKSKSESPGFDILIIILAIICMVHINKKRLKNKKR